MASPVGTSVRYRCVFSRFSLLLRLPYWILDGVTGLLLKTGWGCWVFCMSGSVGTLSRLGVLLVLLGWLLCSLANLWSHVPGFEESCCVCVSWCGGTKPVAWRIVSLRAALLIKGTLPWARCAAGVSRFCDVDGGAHATALWKKRARHQAPNQYGVLHHAAALAWCAGGSLADVVAAFAAASWCCGFFLMRPTLFPL